MKTAGQADPQRPALVLLHGFALHSGLWGDWPAGLASRVEPRAIDLPGHGTRPWDPRITDLAQSVSHDGVLGACDDDAEFEFGLDLILDGLDRRR